MKDFKLEYEKFTLDNGLDVVLHEGDVAVTKNKVLKSNTLSYQSLGSKISLLRESSKYGKPTNFIETDQQELMKMTVADFQSIINQYMKESDMVYLIVGDEKIQLEEVKKFKTDVKVLDNGGIL